MRIFVAWNAPAKKMRVSVTPPVQLRGRVALPSSKSLSNRALTLCALAGGGSELVENLSECDDTRVMRQWLSGDGAHVDIGAAGTAMRFSTALLAVTPGEHLITGSERMCHRPISLLVEALRQLGAHIDYVGEEGYPPLRIIGRQGLSGGRLSLQGSVSSQYVSALLMIAPTLRQGLQLRLEGEIISRPYIDMTLSLMRAFGAQAAWTDGQTLSVEPVPYQRRAFFVESDWSAASYWYSFLALSEDAGACVELPGLFRPSLQGDSRVAELFRPLGVATAYEAWGVRLTKAAAEGKHEGLPAGGQTEPPMEVDLVAQPDLAQTLVVACCLKGIPFRFSGLQSLRIKETDRLAALRTELSKIGFPVEEREGRQLCWDGRRTEPQRAAAIDTYDDHRMAMAFAPCALATGSVCINNPHVVSKSYPRFWADLGAMGFGITFSAL